MSNYTFTASSCYALSTHEVLFSSNKLTIKLSSTGQVVFTKKYEVGVAFMCQSNDFCIGTLADNGVFTKTVDMSLKKADLKLIEASNNNKFIGTNDEEDSSVTNTYNINNCPVRLVQQKQGVVFIECPCESASGPCSNTCYTYG